MALKIFLFWTEVEKSLKDQVELSAQESILQRVSPSGERHFQHSVANGVSHPVLDELWHDFRTRGDKVAACVGSPLDVSPGYDSSSIPLSFSIISIKPRIGFNFADASFCLSFDMFVAQ